MSHRFIYSTQTDWDAQIALTGDAGTGSLNPTSTPPNQPYTADELMRALYRANAYIRTVFYDFFKDEFKAVDLVSLPDAVREDLIEATNFAASHELVTPGIYSKTVTHANDAGQQLKKTASGLELYENKGGDTTTRIQNEQTIDFTIHTLLDKYREANETDTGRTPFVFGVVSSGS